VESLQGLKHVKTADWSIENGKDEEMRYGKINETTISDRAKFLTGTLFPLWLLCYDIFVWHIPTGNNPVKQYQNLSQALQFVIAGY
jgi:hypothetical protein